MGSLAKVFFCGKSAEILRKVRGSLSKIRFIASGKGEEIQRKVAEISRKFAALQNFFSAMAPSRTTL